MQILIFPHHTKYADIDLPTLYQISSFISNPASKTQKTNLLPQHKDSQTHKQMYLGAVPADLPVILPNQQKTQKLISVRKCIENFLE